VVLIAFGLSLGLAGSLAAARLLEKIIYDTSPHDPAVFLAVSVVLVVVTGLACFFPALRATRVDPIVALSEVVPESWTGRIVNPKTEERSTCQRNDVSTVPI
jgi:hypothetical protein